MPFSGLNFDVNGRTNINNTHGLNHIVLCVKKLLTILSSIVNKLYSLLRGGPGSGDHLMSLRIFTLITKKIFICAPKIVREMATDQ